MSLVRPFKAGAETTENAYTRNAQLVGLITLGIGVLMTIFGAILVLWPVVVGGVGLAYVGGEIIEKTAAAYSAARGQVKAAAVTPPLKIAGSGTRSL
jgi:hypothetical protein